MRRLAASLLTGLAVAAAAVAWMAFAAGFTVLDAGRSERIADVLLEEPAVRDAAADALAAAVRSWLPDGSPVSAAEVDAIARRALDDPRARAALRAALVGSHQRLVGRTDGPVRLDGTALVEAGREALVAAHPELAARLPATPTLAVALPTDDWPDLGGVADAVGDVARTAATIAATLLGLAVLIAADRPRVIGRAGRWALFAGFGWVAVGWLVPSGISRLDEPHLAVLGALLVAVVGPMLAPAFTLVAAGTGALFGARAWKVARLIAPRPDGRPDPPDGRGDPPVRWTNPAARRTNPVRPRPSGVAPGGPYDPTPPVEPGRTWRL